MQQKNTNRIPKQNIDLPGINMMKLFQSYVYNNKLNLNYNLKKLRNEQQKSY